MKHIFSDTVYQFEEVDLSCFLPELRPYVILAEGVYSTDNLTSEGILKIREMFASNLPSDPEVDIQELTVVGFDEATIPVKVFSPKGICGPLPAVLYLHGGGYMTGADAGCYEQIFRYCKTVPCVAVMPEFRLAPENPFPAGVEDCYSVLSDLWNHPERYGVDPNRIAVTGFSCGGAMTIALCLMARDRNGPKIKFQMPVSPTMDDRLETESSRRYTDTRILNYYFLQRVWDNYLGQGHAEKEISPYAAPSRAQSYEGLPPCFLHIAEIDPHYDEAMLYVRRLQQAGVTVEWKEYDQCFHVFEIPCAKTSIGIKANNLLAQKLKEALADI